MVLLALVVVINGRRKKLWLQAFLQPVEYRAVFLSEPGLYRPWKGPQATQWCSPWYEGVTSWWCGWRGVSVGQKDHHGQWVLLCFATWNCIENSTKIISFRMSAYVQNCGLKPSIHPSNLTMKYPQGNLQACMLASFASCLYYKGMKKIRKNVEMCLWLAFIHHVLWKLLQHCCQHIQAAVHHCSK